MCVTGAGGDADGVIAAVAICASVASSSGARTAHGEIEQQSPYMGSDTEKMTKKKQAKDDKRKSQRHSFTILSSHFLCTI